MLFQGGPCAHAEPESSPAFVAPALAVVMDEPGTRLTWSLEQVGRAGAPIIWQPGVFTPAPHAEAVTPAQTPSGEGAGAVLARVERVPEGEGEPGAHDDGWPEPVAILRHTALDQSAAGDGPPVLQRAWIAAYAPDETSVIRGACVLHAGMFGTPRWIMEAWTRRLTDRGWFVLRPLSHPSRFTEFVDIDLGERRPAGVAAGEVARLIDRRIDASAHAVERACDWLEQTRPALRDLPRLAMGISGGAIVLPSIVARSPARYAAVVFVAGGADFFSIAATSNYAPFISAARFREGPRPLSESRRALVADLYRARALLDPYALAPALAGTPTLVLHASLDRAVPARYGDLLWDRLGRPERWVYPVGHELMALTLQGELDRLIDWAERAADKGDHDAPDDRNAP